MANPFEAHAHLTTPHVADACMRLRVELRAAPAGLVPLVAGSRAFGPVLPARHRGSVDVFLEALDAARPGDVLVIDDGGRREAGCIGDLVVGEAKLAGLAGLVVWGLHRDTAELRALGLPVFSFGARALGPQRLEPRERGDLEAASFGSFTVGRGDVVLADDDGALFLPSERLAEILAAASAIARTEARQARALASGTSLRQQLAFPDYLRRRAENPALTFREHLAAIGGAIET